MRALSYKKDAAKIIKSLGVKRPVLPSEIYELVESLSYEVILLIVARSGRKIVRQRVKDFFEKYNGMRIGLRGDDLKAFGLKPGPRFKKILDAVLRRKLDGFLKTKKDELEYAKRLI